MGQSGWWLAVLLDQLKPLFDWSTKSSGLFVNTFPLSSTKWAQIQIYNIWTGQIILPVNFDMFLNIEFQTLLSYSLCNRCGLKQFVLWFYNYMKKITVSFCSCLWYHSESFIFFCNLLIFWMKIQNFLLLYSLDC